MIVCFECLIRCDEGCFVCVCVEFYEFLFVEGFSGQVVSWAHVCDFDGVEEGWFNVW